MTAQSNSKPASSTDYFQKGNNLEPILSRRGLLQVAGLLVGSSLLGVHGATPATADEEQAVVNFGSVPIGQSREVCDPYENTASFPVEIRIYGLNATQFSVNGGLFVVVPPGETLTVCLAFTPTSEGEKTANVETVNLLTEEVLEVSTLVGTGVSAQSPDRQRREVTQRQRARNENTQVGSAQASGERSSASVTQQSSQTISQNQEAGENGDDGNSGGPGTPGPGTPIGAGNQVGGR